MLDQIRKELLLLGDQVRAKKLASFFKTGKGQYGEGDVFLGIPVPEQRKVAKKYIGLSFNDLLELLSGKIHEFRLTALLILVLKYSKADDSEKQMIYNFYLNSLSQIACGREELLSLQLSVLLKTMILMMHFLFQRCLYKINMI